MFLQVMLSVKCVGTSRNSDYYLPVRRAHQAIGLNTLGRFHHTTHAIVAPCDSDTGCGPRIAAIQAELK